MGRKRKGGIPGLSFSWKRATGISNAKSKIARATGIPTTRGGRQRKAGKALGCALPLLALALLVTAFIITAIAQDPKDGTAENKSAPRSTASPTPVDAKAERKRIEADRKAAERREREERKRREAEEKERLKRPASIDIKAPADEVSALLIRQMTAEGYRVTDDSKYRLVFEKEIGGFAGSFGRAMMGGDSPPVYAITFTVAEVQGVTTVVADMAALVRRRFGSPHRTDMNKHKESRRGLETILGVVKYTAEAN